MNKLGTIFNFEFKQYLTKKSTIITFAIYFILAFGITFIPSIFSDNSSIGKIFSGEDNSNFQRSAYIIKDTAVNIDKSYLKEAKEYTDRTALEQDIKNDKIDEAVILTNTEYEYLTKSNSLFATETEFGNIFDTFVRKYSYEAKGLDYFKVQETDKNVPQAKVTKIGSSGDAESVMIKSGIVYFSAFMLYIMVFAFGTVVANNVAREKTNRAMELLVVTVKPSILIVGKVLAFSCVAILQIAVLLGAFFAGAKINLKNYNETLTLILKNIDYNLIIIWLLFSLTGFVMLMFLFSACASLVSRVEEIGTVLTLPIMVFFAAFFLNIYTMGNTGNGKLVEILSLFPLTSYFSMVTRYAVAEVTLLEVVLSYCILFITTIFVAFICIKVYRNATLRYGQKLNFFKLIKNKN